MGVLDVAWWVLVGATLGLYLVLIVRMARNPSVPALDVVPHALVVAAAAVIFGAKVVGLSLADRKRADIAGAALLALGLGIAYVRRRQRKRVASTSVASGDERT